MSDYIFAIPSYNRHEKQETLQYLKQCQIPKERIYIFTQTEEDYGKYQIYQNDATIIFQEANGIAKARNNVLNYFQNKRDVLMLDDDIKQLEVLSNGKLERIENIDAEIARCFEFAKKRPSRFFGLYPVPNAFFMDRSISFKCTVNTVLGFAEGFDCRFDETYKAKEDIALCGKLVRERGGLLRFNYLTARAKHRTNKGGCQETWKTDENEKASIRLAREYPELFVVNKANPSEVKFILKDKAKMKIK